MYDVLWNTAVEIGLLDSLVAIIAAHPFDTIKARLQTIGQIDYGGGEYLYKGPIDCFYKIVRREGVFSLYKGVTLPLISIIPINFLTFYIYEKVAVQVREEGRRLNKVDILKLGAISGMLPAVVVTPLERIKFYMQIPRGFYRYPRTGAFVVKKIIEMEGVYGLWRGTSLTLLRDGLSTAISFLSYHWLKLNCIKNNYLHSNNDMQRGTSRYFSIGLCGGVAGIVAWLHCTPIDYVKTRYQLAPVNKSNYLEIFRGMKTEAERRDVSLLKLCYTGGKLITLRAFCQYAFMFLTFELYKQADYFEHLSAEKASSQSTSRANQSTKDSCNKKCQAHDDADDFTKYDI